MNLILLSVLLGVAPVEMKDESLTELKARQAQLTKDVQVAKTKQKAAMSWAYAGPPCLMGIGAGTVSVVGLIILAVVAIVVTAVLIAEAINNQKSLDVLKAKERELTAVNQRIDALNAGPPPML